jgi:hypothetical protein
VLIVFLLFVFGFLIRLYDLTDLPLDFHPTRQLISAIKARGMYMQGDTGLPEWQRQFAVRQWKGRAEIEPELVERLVSFTYRFTGELLWVGRIYSSLFWLIGGIFLYLLLRSLISPTALFQVLRLPFSIQRHRHWFSARSPDGYVDRCLLRAFRAGPKFLFPGDRASAAKRRGAR